jgi:hypothetical protein
VVPAAVEAQATLGEVDPGLAGSAVDALPLFFAHDHITHSSHANAESDEQSSSWRTRGSPIGFRGIGEIFIGEIFG